MRNNYFKFTCPCGLENYNREDWLSHYKHGIPRDVKPFGKYPKIRAIWLFLNTKITIK